MPLTQREEALALAVNKRIKKVVEDWEATHKEFITTLQRNMERGFEVLQANLKDEIKQIRELSQTKIIPAPQVINQVEVPEILMAQAIERMNTTFLSLMELFGRILESVKNQPVPVIQIPEIIVKDRFPKGFKLITMEDGEKRIIPIK